MSCRLLQSTSFVTSSQSSATAQKSKGPWPPEEEAEMKSSRWSARRHMTHYCCLWDCRVQSGLPGSGEGLGGGNSAYQSIWLGAPGLTDLSLGWWNQSTSTDVSTHWDQQALTNTVPFLLSLSPPPNWHSRSFHLSGAIFRRYHAITPPFLPWVVRADGADQRGPPLCRTTRRCCFSLSWQEAWAEI